MHSVLGNHKTMIHQYTVIVVIHVYNRIIVFTQHTGSRPPAAIDIIRYVLLVNTCSSNKLNLLSWLLIYLIIK